VCVHVCVYVRVCTCMRVYVCSCVSMYARVRAQVHTGR